jgi:hypothetical protein
MAESADRGSQPTPGRTQPKGAEQARERAPIGRLAAAFALLSAWLVLLLVGSPLGAAVYLLLVAALAVFPWRLLRFDEAPPR